MEQVRIYQITKVVRLHSYSSILNKHEYSTYVQECDQIIEVADFIAVKIG